MEGRFSAASQPVDLLPCPGLPRIGTLALVFLKFASKSMACMKL